MYKRVRQYLFSMRIKKPDRVEDGDAQGLQGVLFDLHEHLSAARIERVVSSCVSVLITKNPPKRVKINYLISLSGFVFFFLFGQAFLIDIFENLICSTQ